jgi:hypothetical protein
MGILNYRPEELTNQRKLISDAKNQGDNLTIDNKGARSSHGEAAAGVRAFKDDLELEALQENGDRAYLESLVFN